MQLEFSASNSPEEWLSSVASQFGVPVKNNAFELSSTIGEGIFKHFYAFAGLTLSYLYFKVFSPVEFIRKAVASDQSSLVPVMFYNWDLPRAQNIENQSRPIGYHTPNGIFMPSPEIGSRWVMPENTRICQITLSFDRNWLLKSLNNKTHSYIDQLLSSGKPFYLFESLTPQMMQITGSIHDIICSESTLQKLFLHQKTMELLVLFLKKAEQRTVVKDEAGLSSSDIERIFQTRKQLLENLTEPPSVAWLALGAGMSVSKLQKCFQQVFGKSISQYALSEKINLAKQLLDSKKYSVSEVGYQLGYSNLSHFSKAFHKEFRMNPKAYLSSL